MAKQELLATIRDRYRASSKREKSRILDEFIAVTGHHRKHGIRLLGQSGDDGEQQPAAKKGRRIYDEAVRQAVIVVWEAADRICGKRLKAALPHLVESPGGVPWWSPWSATATSSGVLFAVSYPTADPHALNDHGDDPHRRSKPPEQHMRGQEAVLERLRRRDAGEESREAHANVVSAVLRQVHHGASLTNGTPLPRMMALASWPYLVQASGWQYTVSPIRSDRNHHESPSENSTRTSTRVPSGSSSSSFIWKFRASCSSLHSTSWLLTDTKIRSFSSTGVLFPCLVRPRNSARVADAAPKRTRRRSADSRPGTAGPVVRCGNQPRSRAGPAWV